MPDPRDGEVNAETLKKMRKRQADFRAVFSGAAGDRVLKDLTAFCLGDGQCHVPGDPFDTAFNEGKRRVWLRITSVMGQSAEAIIRKARETSYD